MENKDYYGLKLSNLKGFFTDPRTVSFLKINDIYDFGDLIKFTKTNKYEKLKNSNFELSKELEGSIKLIKYNFFGENLDFDKETELCDFGFSTKAYLGIKHFKLMDEFDSWFEALQVFGSEDVLEIFSYVHMISPDIIDEIREKSQIINDYHREKLHIMPEEGARIRTR